MYPQTASTRTSLEPGCALPGEMDANCAMRRPQVAEELDILEKAVCELEHALGELLAKLAPVCVDKAIAIAAHSNGLAPGESSLAPLAGKIRDLRRRIEGNTAEIKGRRSQLEI